MKSILAIACFCALTAAIADAETLTFDDLPSKPSSGTPPFPTVPSGYGGFQWSGFYVLDAENTPGGFTAA